MITYTHIYSVKATRDFTRCDLIILCDDFEQLYENVRVSPEGITEGGILFEYPNPQFYKSLRFGGINGRHVKWPWIAATTRADWVNDSTVLLHSGDEITPLVKCFHGAPVMTLAELRAWEPLFAQNGLKRTGKYPLARDLREANAELGGPCVIAARPVATCTPANDTKTDT